MGREAQYAVWKWRFGTLGVGDGDGEGEAREGWHVYFILPGNRVVIDRGLRMGGRLEGP